MGKIIDISAKGSQTTGYPHEKEWIWSACLYLKWIKSKYKSYKILERKQRHTSSWFELKKRKNDNLNFMKVENFYAAKEYHQENEQWSILHCSMCSAAGDQDNSTTASATLWLAHSQNNLGRGEQSWRTCTFLFQILLQVYSNQDNVVVEAVKWWLTRDKGCKLSSERSKL